MDIKKMMAALAVAGMATGGFAVESSNIVGYQQYELTGEEYVHNVGVQFQNTAEESYVISNSFFGAALVDYDVIYIFDPDYFGYTEYTYMDFGGGTYGFSVVFADGSAGDAVYSITVNKGDNVLYIPGDTTSKPTVAGQVEASGTKVLTFTVDGDNYIFPITNPFPQATKLSDLTCLQDYDVIYVWDSEYFGYTEFTYMDFGGGVHGFSVVFADGSAGDAITDPNFVLLGVGQGGMYMPGDSREWSVTMNY